jgi:2-keto-4-pentenoate hydratase/2-oxohepta-3-ene-1,7-dioic acid hydratase in catechol pathway
MRALILAAGVSVLGACAGDPPPVLNAFSGEDAPLEIRMLPPEAGLTLAQTRNAAGQPVTLLVTALRKDGVDGIDLTAAGAVPGADMFDAVAAVGAQKLADLRTSGVSRRYARRDLLSPAGAGEAHIASGTNFIEHQQEADINAVFNFPKFGPASPAVSTVKLKQRVLLDYEVELCVRFDRDIGSLADFDAAKKGFFVCGDFSDRTTLVERIDRTNMASGIGFSDAKSGPDFFPTGPVLVIPNDWAGFVRDERMITQVNGGMRQDARGGEMIRDFRVLTEYALKEKENARFVHEGKKVTLFPGSAIPRGAALMSGTSEGVIFMPPIPEDYAEGQKLFQASGAPMSEAGVTAAVIAVWVEREMKAKRYLQPGDKVEHASAHTGALQVTVVDGR